MPKIEIPIRIDLPENWADIVAEKVRKDGDFALVVRCGECKKRRTPNCPLFYGRETSTTGNDDWYCADGERKDVEHDN